MYTALKWIYENIAAKTHVRGPIKAYRAECFDDINVLKSYLFVLKFSLL